MRPASPPIVPTPAAPVSGHLPLVLQLTTAAWSRPEGRASRTMASLVLLTLAAAARSADVPGVCITNAGFTSTVTIRSTHASGAVIAIALDATTHGHQITVDGVTGEVPAATGIDVYGSAAGGDTVTITDAALVINATLYGNGNQLAVHNGATCEATLMGDQDTVDATGGSALITACAGANNLYTGHTELTGTVPWTPSTLPGLCSFGYGQVLIVSSRAQGTTCSVQPGSATGSATITLDGQTITLPSGVGEIDYVGSAAGGDTLQLQGFGGSILVWGSDNDVTLHTPGAEVITVLGSDNTVTSTGNGIEGTVWGSGETLTGVDVVSGSATAPALLPASPAASSTGGSGSAGGSATGTGSTSASGTGTGSGSGSAGTTTASAPSSGTTTAGGATGAAGSATGGSSGGCGLAGGAGALALVLAGLVRRARCVRGPDHQA